MYLSQADVQRIFAVIAGRFPEAAVFVETMSPMVVRRSGKSPSRAAMRNSPGAGGRAARPRCCRTFGLSSSTA